MSPADYSLSGQLNGHLASRSNLGGAYNVVLSAGADAKATLLRSFDLRPIHREYVAEALEGVLKQADAAIEFLYKGDDVHAENAMRLATKFFRHAAGTMNELLAENRKRTETREVAP